MTVRVDETGQQGMALQVPEFDIAAGPVKHNVAGAHREDFAVPDGDRCGCWLGLVDGDDVAVDKHQGRGFRYRCVLRIPCVGITTTAAESHSKCHTCDGFLQ